MTQEEKQILLKDLCGRLPYNVKVYVKFYGDFDDEIQEYTFVLNNIDTKYPNHYYWVGGEQLQESGKFKSGTTDFSVDIDDEEQEVKPYLRPISSMTEDEFVRYSETREWVYVDNDHYEHFDTLETFDWLNAHHFDYRGLIFMGLALEAPEDMYKSD